MCKNCFKILLIKDVLKQKIELTKCYYQQNKLQKENYLINLDNTPASFLKGISKSVIYLAIQH